MARFLVLSSALLLLLIENTKAQALPPIGIIDFYGLRSVPEADVRNALSLSVGDAVPAAVNDIRARLQALPHVATAHLEVVCCDHGRSILYVGIEERGSHTVRFRRAPTGTHHLSLDVIEAGDAFERAFTEAVLRGDAEEDDSNGHALMHDPAARAIQERFIGYAARDFDRLRAALRNARNDRDRALAAVVLAYSKDKRAIVPDLVRAMRDPAKEVRNNAMRALAIISGFSRRFPALGIRIADEPFVDLLSSPVWSDRNKSTWAIEQMSINRDPRLLKMLARRALPAVVEMARWHSDGHAADAFFLLGRLGNASEPDIEAAWRGDGRQASIRRWSLEAARRWSARGGRNPKPNAMSREPAQNVSRRPSCPTRAGT
jgi:HEAT repeat protein